MTPTSIERASIKQILDALDQEFAAVAAEPLHLIICGGAAFLLLGLGHRHTKDIDLIEPTISPELLQAATKVAKAFGLPRDWINNGPSVLAKDLPRGWKERVTSVFQGQRLAIFAIGREDLILTKLYAHADRGHTVSNPEASRDLADLLLLKPTSEEIKIATALVMKFDANPEWPAWVQKVSDYILQRLAPNPSGGPTDVIT